MSRQRVRPGLGRLLLAWAVGVTGLARADLFQCPIHLSGNASSVILEPSEAMPALSLPQALRIPFHFAIQAVLDEGGRAENATISQGPEAHSALVRTEVGEYLFVFTDDPTEGFPKHGLPQIRIARGRLHTRVVIYRGDIGTQLDRVQGRVRSAFRADPYLHPHLRTPGATGRLRLSRPQTDALNALIAMEDGRRGRRRGLAMPVAMGKTVVAAKYVEAIGGLLRERGARGWATLPPDRHPRVLFVVENTHVLDRSVETFVEELGLTNIARVYGDHRDRWDRNAQMIAITRSSYHNRRDEIHRLLGEDPNQPWVIIFDEAHHVGKRNGQFARIQADLGTVMDHRHRELNLSPFFYHRDRVLIRDHLRGNVWGAFLDDREQQHLRAGRHLVDLVRAQYYRGMMYGYLEPLFRLTMVRQVNGAPAIDLLGEERPIVEGGTARVDWHPALLDDVRNRVRAARTPGIVDRGVFFVDSRARADVYARELSRRLGEEVRVLHSGEEVDPETYDWFSDRGRFANATNRRRHKYIVVVDMLREGVDIPAINMIFLLRRYGSDMGGFGNLIQTLGRGNRLFGIPPFFKTSLRVFDYTLYTRWFRDGLSAISIESPPSPTSGTGAAAPYIVVDDELMSPVQFEARYYDLFPQDVSFVSRYSFYDHRLFVDEMVPELYRQATYLGIQPWKHDRAPMKLAIALAEALPDSPEKEDLLARLRDFERWGWRPTDGQALSHGGIPACRRMYEALQEIFSLLALDPRGAGLDPSALRDGRSLREFLDRLLPERRPLHGRAIERFVDPRRGGLAVLVDEMPTRIDTTLRRPREVLRFLASRLPASPRRDAIFEALEDSPFDSWQLGYRELRLDAAGRRALAANPSSIQWSYNRVFRVWQMIAAEYNRVHPERSQISFARLHERGETERLVEALVPARAETGVLDDANLRIFFDAERGGYAVVRQRQENFDVTEFMLSWGPRDFVRAALAMVPQTPENSDERAALARDFDDRAQYAWERTDGNSLGARWPRVSNRFFRALQRIAALYQRSVPGAATRASEIHTRRGMEIFLDELFLGFALPPLTPEMAQRMQTTTDGLNSAVLSLRARYGVASFSEEYGVRRIFAAMAERLGDSPQERRLIALIGNDARWGWSPWDANNLRRGRPSMHWRIYRAVAAILHLSRQLHGCPISLGRALTPEGLRELSDWLESD